ncbi:MAG: type I glutamate--ammonia ligase, partial [Ignavibacteriales bacterium]
GRFLAKYVAKNKEFDIENLYKYGIGFDGSSVRGFADINESDLMLFPDKLTNRIITENALMIPGYSVISIIADVYRGFGQGRLSKDPRYVSHCMEEHLKQKGLICQIGAEVECFIFDDIAVKDVKDNDHDNEEPKVISIEQYGAGKYPIRTKEGYDAPPFQDSLSAFRFEVSEILTRQYAIDVTNLMHEVASNGQIEINFKHSTLTRSADNVQIYKDVVRNVAKQHNKVSNFMPKPIFNEEDLESTKGNDNGSGMHTSISLWEESNNNNNNNNTNIFYEENDGYAEISQIARYFIGGILDHASSLAAFVTPTVNSYYRLIPGFEAPIYVAWARGNRSTIIRVPVDERNNYKTKRIEFRAPDPSANPYLAFSAIVAAGLDGIKNKIEPGNPIDKNVYKMSDFERSNCGIKSLPTSLEGSLGSLKSDSKYLDVCFLNDLIDAYLMLKEEEIAQIGKVNTRAKQFMSYYDV